MRSDRPRFRLLGKVVLFLVTSFAQLTQGISRTRAQQADGVEGVVRAMQAIADVAVHTEQAVLQTRRTVEDLVKLAGELMGSMGRFELAGA
jgi:methyl-accepting chemotaxis protein